MIVEQIVEGIIQIPKIIPQRRVQQWSVEQIVVVLVLAHHHGRQSPSSPSCHHHVVANHHRHHHVEQKLYVDVLVSHEMKEIRC